MLCGELRNLLEFKAPAGGLAETCERSIVRQSEQGRIEMLTFEQRLDMITVHAWEIWTYNGLNLDEDEKIQTDKSVKDAATTAYQDEYNDEEWLDATLSLLGNRRST